MSDLKMCTNGHEIDSGKDICSRCGARAVQEPVEEKVPEETDEILTTEEEAETPVEDLTEVPDLADVKIPTDENKILSDVEPVATGTMGLLNKTEAVPPVGETSETTPEATVEDAEEEDKDVPVDPEAPEEKPVEEAKPEATETEK